MAIIPSSPDILPTSTNDVSKPTETGENIRAENEESQSNERRAELREANCLLETIEQPDRSVEITSNTEGKIQEVIFQRGNDGFDAAYISFMKNRPEISITMVVSSDNQKSDFVKKMEMADIPAAQCRFIIMDTNDSSISVWARDSYVMTKASNGTNVVMEPRGRVLYPDQGDRDVADRIVATTGERLITSSLVFDGGDMRASGNNLFVGAITIVQNIPEGELATPENVQKIVKAFEKQFGKNVIVVGFTQEMDGNSETANYLAPLTTEVEKAEPVFHLDLYFTPLNEHTVAIADPSLTKEILRMMPTADLDQAENNLGKTENPKDSSEIINALKNFKDSPESLPNQQQLDEIATRMTSRGFTVIRIPYFQDRHFPMSYNNALVENYAEHDKPVTQVTLPQYGIKELDMAAVTAYEHAGIRVRPINGFFHGIYQQGALDCLTSEKRG